MQHVYENVDCAEAQESLVLLRQLYANTLGLSLTTFTHESL